MVCFIMHCISYCITCMVCGIQNGTDCMVCDVLHWVLCCTGSGLFCVLCWVYCVGFDSLLYCIVMFVL